MVISSIVVLTGFACLYQHFQYHCLVRSYCWGTQIYSKCLPINKKGLFHFLTHSLLIHQIYLFHWGTIYHCWNNNFRIILLFIFLVNHNFVCRNWFGNRTNPYSKSFRNFLDASVMLNVITMILLPIFLLTLFNTLLLLTLHNRNRFLVTTHICNNRFFHCFYYIFYYYIITILKKHSIICFYVS